MAHLYLGMDFGTSGARACAIDATEKIHAQAKCSYGNSATDWEAALFGLLEQIPLVQRREMQAIAIDATSSTVLLCDATGNPIADPLLYNDDRGKVVVGKLQTIAPPDHTVLSATSSLAKLLWWQEQGLTAQAQYLLHQADWLGFLLHGKLGVSDYHNCLKLGYDVGELRYPNWLSGASIAHLLPSVVLAPGTPIGPVQPAVGDRFGLPADCQVCAGTTDSIAAFLASGAAVPGEAVTSLGSTLVLKLLSQTRVDNQKYGIYSHRLGDLWLVGGASNTGGAVLRQFFTDVELQDLSQQIDPAIVTPLDYYPLVRSGERFPLNDPHLPPRLTPRPADAGEFLHGLLEGMARIEAQGYQRLQELGATPLTQVYTAGGGAQNAVWRAIRSRCLGVPVVLSEQTEAAYGTARSALRGCSRG